MYSISLIKELDLLCLKQKQTNNSTTTPIQKSTQEQILKQVSAATSSSEKRAQVSEQKKLDKNEFRLLVKMLKAINHDCVYDAINYDGRTVTYQYSNKTLVFGDITIPDTNQTINLSSLSDLLTNNQLKRPVWEKLKTLTN